MRFGGHETFPIREDWLPKAIRLLEDDPMLFSDPFVSDRLGVGRNMAKSIRHWLSVTGLAERSTTRKEQKLTKVGEEIYKEDPYFLLPGTWWALHINSVVVGKDAVVWKSFFNYFFPDRFDRIRCFSDIRRQLAIEGHRLPSATTLNRDIGCLLSSYATPVPPVDHDPEDGHDCPLRALDLISHLRETDTYSMNRKKKDIPSMVIGYALSVALHDSSLGKHTSLPLSQAYSASNRPGRTLVLDSESLVDTIQQMEEDLGSDLCHVEISGGERQVRVRNFEPSEWLKRYYRKAV